MSSVGPLGHSPELRNVNFDGFNHVVNHIRQAVIEVFEAIQTFTYNVLYGLTKGAHHFVWVSIPVSFIGALIIDFFTDLSHLMEFEEGFKDIPWQEVIVIGPIVEELFFRGALQSCIKYVTGKIFEYFEEEGLAQDHAIETARVVTSIAFGAAHLLNGTYYAIIQAVLTTIMGYVILSPLRETHGLEGAIGAHMMNNFLAMVPEMLFGFVV